MLDFGREIASHPVNALEREWLVTNGIGGYASGTVANVLTRRYHGLLVAALQPPLGRTVLLSKVEERVTYNDRAFELFSNQWHHPDSPPQPLGFAHQVAFRLEGNMPVWTFAFGDALLEKRVWMPYGDNTTFIAYALTRATLPVTLTIKALVNYRDFHTNIHAGDWQMRVQEREGGVMIQAHDAATPFYLFSEADLTTHHDWYREYALSAEAYRGQDALGDHLHVATFNITLEAGQSFAFSATTHADAPRDAEASLRATLEREGRLVDPQDPVWIQRLRLAADQFIVRRAAQDNPNGRSILAGYHWFGDWGRDTMISLPGLTLNTGRADEAASILRTFAQHVDRGMLPNRFPDSGEQPEYNTVDATLWYFSALHAYHQATEDDALLRELYPVLADIIEWHQRGTRYRIRIDEKDGLLYAGEAGVQLTWMDAKIDDWVVTPRTGKAIEINALWYNALRFMSAWAERLGEIGEHYARMAAYVEKSFARFWSPTHGHCLDVIDGPEGNDPALRPNQLFAVSLTHSPLSAEQQRAVVDVCGRYLLTSLGLRSLAPHDPHYIGHYGGDRFARDGAYHQGTVWTWLLGPFVAAHLRVYGDKTRARSFIEPIQHHLREGCLGTLTEIADGDPPHRPRGAVAQAWSVAEILRAYDLTR